MTLAQVRPDSARSGLAFSPPPSSLKPGPRENHILEDAKLDNLDQVSIINLLIKYFELSMMAISITTLSIKGLIVTPSICYAEYREH